MNVKILFSDNLHFHDNNFKSLLDIIKKQKFDVEYNLEHKDWMSLYGDYSNKYNNLQSYTQLLNRLSITELYEYESRGINIYSIAEAELLSYLIPAKELYLLDLSDDSTIVFNYIFKNHKDDLILNMSASLFWLDFWYNRVISHKKKYTHVFTFSGSSIYSKALIKICEQTISRIFVTESSLTGNDFYIEEKNSHIANNSDIKLLSVRRKHLKALENDENKYNTKIKAINKFNQAKNKNVTQPYSDETEINFNNNHKTIAIIGQVVNDYSIIETKFGNISSISIYKKIINEILEKTNFNIIFKAHPWESKKSNCNSDITFDEINNIVNEKSDNERVRVVKDFDINLILSKSNHAILINSQAGLEAASHGIKPIIIGDAFYGNFGFTYDCNNIEEILKILTTTSGTLSLDEYDNFETFITIYLEKHLYSVFPSGQGKALREIITPYHKIPLTQKTQPKKIENSTPKENTQNDELLKMIENDITELSTVNQIKNGIFYLFTDFEKFKKKLRNKI
jgi:hypothetical protein